MTTGVKLISGNNRSTYGTIMLESTDSGQTIYPSLHEDLYSDGVPLCGANGQPCRHWTCTPQKKIVLGLRMSSWLLCAYVMFYVAYLVSGALMFTALETPVEMDIKNELRLMRNAFLEKAPCVQDDDLEKLIQAVIAASNRGVSAARNVSGEPNWSFGQSLFFSSTVVTTIGYGHVTPLSKSGKIFCMLYALMGIPLTLVLLTALVERLLVPATWLLQFLNSRLGHLYQPFNIRLLHLFFIVLMLTGLFLCVPAAIFASLEPEWDFLDSLYYCFISLTTIGLGDYIPGDHPNQPYRPLYKVATTVYLFIGLTFMMLTLTVFYDIPQLNLGALFSVRSGDAGSGPICEPEKLRLASSAGGSLRSEYGGASHTGSTGTVAGGGTGHRSVVRVRSRRDDSPSPEDTTPVHARDMLVP